MFLKAVREMSFCLNVCCTHVSAGAIQAGKLYVVFPGISPVDAVINEVQGESIGPSDLIFHDDTSVRAIHPNPPNVWTVTPVWPVQVPNKQGIVLVYIYIFI